VKLLLDANLSPEVSRRLAEAGHDTIHVAEIEMVSATDPEILAAAAQQERVLISADSDFGELLALDSLASPSVVLLRSADHLRPAEQAELLAANLGQIAEELAEGAIASLSAGHLRVRTLPIVAERTSD